MEAVRLQKYIPHRSPMVWIDRVLEATSTSATCELVLKSGEAYLDCSQFLRPTSCIEFIAQAYAFAWAARMELENPQTSKDMGPPKRAFLAAVKTARLPTSEQILNLKVGDSIKITVENFRQIGEITMFNGEVFDSSSRLIASASLKVFAEV